MVKFRSAGDKAAYEVAVGVHDADEAAELGLAVVESDPTTGAPLAYGRYKNAPKGGALGITVAGSEDDSHVVPGGSVGPGAPAPAGGKGALESPGDPVIHGGSDEIHADNAPPPSLNPPENKEQTEPAKTSTKKK